jgi:hypothetical protein
MLICLDQRTGAGCGAQNRDGARHCVKCGMSLRFALQLQNPGAVIGHYRIVRVLGHGGFGAVYEAEDTQQPGLHVALKETFDPTSIGSYQKEFAVLRTLQHPNLPRYYEMFEYLGNGYLVMELVPGQSLDEVLDSQAGQPLLESQVLGYTIQVCDALSYLHSQNPPIIHRDIKPANIRITPAGLIKLVDFGLLKQGTGTTQSSRRGLTPAYAPIEQYGLVAGLHTDPRSDIYSLGATLYHLLTGQVPLPAADRIAVTPDPLPPPQRVNPRLSPHVASAVMTAMNLLPKDRYADAATMKQALLKQPVHAPVPPQGAPHVANVPQTLPVANKPPLAVALTVALLVITGVPGLVVGVGAIGILAAILMWFGKKWGRRLGILYLSVGSALVGISEYLLFALPNVFSSDKEHLHSMPFSLRCSGSCNSWRVCPRLHFSATMFWISFTRTTRHIASGLGNQLPLSRGCRFYWAFGSWSRWCWDSDCSIESDGHWTPVAFSSR